MPISSAPIGVFDSGMGGLTVLRALRAELPSADFVYLGDTARLPYGTKSPRTVEAYALQTTSLLVDSGVAALVVACNTASAFALPALRQRYPELPIFGVIEPGSEAAAQTSASGRIGVLATESTVASNAYQRAILSRRKDAVVRARPAPVLVALAEASWIDGEAARAVLAQYLDAWLDPLVGSVRPDTLLLGCTHFPALLPAISELIGDRLQIVDSAETTARMVAAEGGFGGGGNGEVRYVVTDGPERFRRLAPIFLGEPVAAVEVVDL